MSRDEHLMRPLEPRVRKLGRVTPAQQARRLILRRAMLTMMGAVLAVAPAFILRLVFAVVTGDVTPLTFLPFELVAPFAVALSMLTARPGRETLQLAASVFFAAFLSAPLFVAMAMGKELTGLIGGTGGLPGEPWMQMMAMVPALGTLGLVGMVFLCFPLMMVSIGMIAGADFLYLKSHRQELLDLEAARQIERSKKDGVYDVPGLPRAELEALTREFDALRDELAAIPSLRGLLDAALKRLADYAEVLHRKLKPTELTYVRYINSGMHLYKTLIAHIARGAELTHAGHEGAAELDRILQQGEGSLRIFDEATRAVRRLRVGVGSGRELDVAAKDLEELAQRAEKY